MCHLDWLRVILHPSKHFRLLLEEEDLLPEEEEDLLHLAEEEFLFLEADLLLHFHGIKHAAIRVDGYQRIVVSLKSDQVVAGVHKLPVRPAPPERRRP